MLTATSVRTGAVRLAPGWRRLAAFLFLLGVAVAAFGDVFKISDIRVEGLQRIAPGTVFNYMPVQVGDTVGDDVTASIIRSLYQTGFFNDVRVEREGTVLVVSVQERPAIAELTITGNNEIKEEDLKKGLKDIGLAEGRVFNRSILDRIEQELKRQYFALGKYGVRIQSTVSPLERNRVAVRIEIAEGLTARIKQINIIGNQAFSEKELLARFKLGTHRWHSFYSKNDQYSKQKLAGDLESLRSYYLDRGYIKFDIKSTQVSISADKKDIYITIVLSEGGVYTIGDIKLAGEPTIPTEKLFSLIHLRRGEPFSRAAVTESSERISGLLGDEGYAFANVNNIPDIDEEKKQVTLTFFVDPGKRVYVRRVNMKGNTRTRDEVLRREMRQLETAWFSADLVKKSRERLKRLGYFEEVNIETPAVPGSADQVDVEVGVTEKASGNLLAGIGYSQSQGIMFNASVSQNNFLGSGKRLVFAFNNSQVSQVYRLAFDNPYYTVDGISRGFEASYVTTDFDQLVGARYSTDVGVLGMNFGIPITETSRMGLGLRYQYTKLKTGDDVLAQDFIDTNGDQFNDFILSANYTRDSRDNAVFPTDGNLNTVVADIAVPGSDLTYYRLTYKARTYIPLTRRFTLSARGDIGYGDGYGDLTALPFFENFFVGGPQSVRGFEASTLGPRETNPDYAPVGGNLKFAGSVELFAPPPVEGDFAKTLRIGLFFDFGNVWETTATDLVTPTGFDLGELRYSTGLSLAWLSPVGALSVSVAYPLNAKEEDNTQIFQFTFGQGF